MAIKPDPPSADRRYKRLLLAGSILLGAVLGALTHQKSGIIVGAAMGALAECFGAYIYHCCRAPFALLFAFCLFSSLICTMIGGLQEGVEGALLGAVVGGVVCGIVGLPIAAVAWVALHCGANGTSPKVSPGTEGEGQDGEDGIW
jgi:hypothetical protein